MDKERQSMVIENEINAVMIENNLPFFKGVGIRLPLVQINNICDSLEKAIESVANSSTGSKIEEDFIGQDGHFNLLLEKLRKKGLGSIGISSKEIEIMHMGMCIGSNTFDVLLGRTSIGEVQQRFIESLLEFKMAGIVVSDEVWEFWDTVRING